jgi:transcriptional regulator with XRE-family HTH domain
VSPLSTWFNEPALTPVTDEPTTQAWANPEHVFTASVSIGARLKAARRSRHKTLTQVASAGGLTKSYLSKIERDQATASLPSLMRLCAALEISLGSLFDANTGVLVRQHQYPTIDFGGRGLREFLLTPHGEQRLQALLSEIEPGGGSGVKLYALPVEVEFVLVLEGRLTIQLESRELVLTAGDALTFPAQTPHGFYNPDSETTTRVLWVFAPALLTPRTDGQTEAAGPHYVEEEFNFRKSRPPE